MKNSTTIKIPKKYEKYIVEVWYEGTDDGYWAELIDCCMCEDTDCRYVHEWTQKDFLRSLQSIKVMSETEYKSITGGEDMKYYYESLKTLEEVR